MNRLKLGSEIVAAAAVAVGLGVGLFFGKALPPSVPLFYSRPWGEEQLVPNYWLAIPPLLAVVISICSVFVSKLLKDEPVLNVITLASGMMVSIILIMGMLRSVMLIV